MKAVMNKETVEINIKEQLAQLISKYATQDFLETKESEKEV